MKKFIIAMIALLASITAATPLYIGVQAKKRFLLAHEYLQQELLYPQLSVAAGDYHQGWLKSETSTVFTITPDKKDAIPLVFRMVHHISTIPAFGSGSIMSVDSQLVLPAELKKKLEPYFHGKPLLSSHTLVKFDGSETSTISSPSYSGPLQDDESARLEWQGLHGTTTSDANFSNVSVTLDIPGFSIEKPDTAVQFGKLHYSSQRHRGSHDLWFGHDDATLENLQFNAMSTRRGPANLQMAGLAMTSMQNENGPLVNLHGRLTFDSANLNGLTLHNAVYDIAYNNLDAASLSRLSTVIKQAMRQHPDDPRQIVASMKPLFQALLSKKPELALSEFRVETPLGKVSARLNVALTAPLTDEIMQEPRGLLDIMNVDLTASVPKPMIIGLIGSSANNSVRLAAQRQKEKISEEELIRKVNTLTQQQIQELLNQKLMVDNGDNFDTVVHYVPPQLLINGQDASPMLNGLKQK